MMKIVHSNYLSDSEKKDPPFDNALLLNALAGGSIAAFERIYSHFWHKMYIVAYNILRNKEACEDIVQDIFSQLWNRRAHLDIRNLESYLITAVRFQVFRSINEQKCRNNLILTLTKLPADFFEQAHVYQEIEEALQQGIEQLPEKCSKIFYLSRKKQLSNKEIAKQLNISVKTVENQITIAIKKLRKYLSPWTMPVLLSTILNLFN
ncbi:RNA polymerase sigma-70 factor [Sphingobacterium thalpophilum]|uniref:RNA polymerase sigma-70 factor n=1 Tax=Sphingobacterium thalpophilum TaxID=259 RepID=UPI0024A6D4A4|nr:RNA polymerase sigma-70 factor [Sphingobacterium thalpophilum]